VFAQQQIETSVNGSTVSDGSIRYNFMDGEGTTAHVTPNSDGSVDVSFDADGGGVSIAMVRKIAATRAY
jgi:hypothetical protein